MGSQNSYVVDSQEFAILFPRAPNTGPYNSSLGTSSHGLCVGLVSFLSNIRRVLLPK